MPEFKRGVTAAQMELAKQFLLNWRPSTNPLEAEVQGPSVRILAEGNDKIDVGSLRNALVNIMENAGGQVFADAHPRGKAATIDWKDIGPDATVLMINPQIFAEAQTQLRGTARQAHG